MSQIMEAPKCDVNKEKKVELLVEGYLYDITSFIDRHPGGRVIEFYSSTGEDAKHAIQQYHFRSQNKVNLIMKSLRRRPASLELGALKEAELNRRAALSEDYEKLYKELQNEGMFETSFKHNLIRLIEILILGVLGYHLSSHKYVLIQILGLLLASLAHGRCAWMEHEAGHRTLTGIVNVDRVLQSILFGVGVGMSSNVWNTRHKRHHAMPNKLNYDIDLELMPLVLSDMKILKDHDKQFLWIAKYQVFLIPLTGLMFILTHQLFIHPLYVLRNHCYLDAISMLLHYVVGLQLGFFQFFIVNFLSTFYVQMTLALNHTSLPVTSETYHWVEFTFLHTMNINPTWYNDWWTGFVNYQIEHHLFPAMPHFRHRLIVPRVKELAKKHGLPYYVESYFGAVATTLKSHYLVQKELQEMF